MADETLSEQWRPVEGFPGYQVSNLGHVLGKRGRILSPTKRGHRLEYPSVNLFQNGTTKTEAIHILVCLAFIGPKPSPRHQVAHWDGNPANCAATNLRWATPRENALDRLRHGRGNSRPDIFTPRNRKLTEQDVREILSEHTLGATTLGKKYGVSPSTIYDIWSGNKWRHITSLASGRIPIVGQFKDGEFINAGYGI